MSEEPMEIPADLAAKYEDAEGHPERFQSVVKAFLAAPKTKEAVTVEKRPKGRPKKKLT